MSATREYYHLIFPQKNYYGDYLFFYDDGENNVVGLIHHTLDSEYTPEAYMPYEDVINTVVDDILEATERQNGKICDDSYSIFGQEQ